MQYHTFEALAFPWNQDKYYNIRRNWEVLPVIKKLNFDDVIKANHVIFVFICLYKPINICSKFQGYNYSQLEIKYG